MHGRFVTVTLADRPVDLVNRRSEQTGSTRTKWPALLDQLGMR